jgi:hypothetical protein
VSAEARIAELEADLVRVRKALANMSGFEREQRARAKAAEAEVAALRQALRKIAANDFVTTSYGGFVRTIGASDIARAALAS